MKMITNIDEKDLEESIKKALPTLEKIAETGVLPVDVSLTPSGDIHINYEGKPFVFPEKYIENVQLFFNIIIPIIVNEKEG